MKSTQEIIREAETLFQTGDFDRAKDLLTQVVDHDPQHVEALNDLGVLAYQKQRLTEAERWFRKALQHDDSFIEAHLNLLAIMLDQYRFAEALVHTLHLLESDVRNPDLLHYLDEVVLQIILDYVGVIAEEDTATANNLATNPALKGRVIAALNSFEQKLKDFPYKEKLLVLSVLFLLAGKNEEALRFARELLATANERLEHFLLLIKLHLFLYDVHEAAAILRHARKEFGENELLLLLEKETQARSTTPAVSSRYGDILLFIKGTDRDIADASIVVQMIGDILPESTVAILCHDAAARRKILDWPQSLTVHGSPEKCTGDVCIIFPENEDVSKRWRETLEQRFRSLFEPSGTGSLPQRVAEFFGFKGDLPEPYQSPEQPARQHVFTAVKGHEAVIAPGDKLSRLRQKEEIRVQIVSPSDFDRDEQRRPLWGDYWVKYELSKELNALNFRVVDSNPDVIFYLFGMPVSGLSTDTYNIVWVYSHPDAVTAENLKVFDKIYALSPALKRKLEALGYDDIELMLGATSKKPIETEIKYDVVFVGNSRGHFGRKIVTDLGDIPWNFKVWGNGWDELLPERYIGGRYFDNQRLGELYASSLVSINDHHPDMSRDGMVAVKIFDILASNGFAISDRNPGIDAIFGDAVPQYEDATHLREMLALYIKSPDTRLEMMRAGQEIALQHTWEKRARQIADHLRPQPQNRHESVPEVIETANRAAAERKPRVLYVDTLSAPHAACNVNGMQKAYRKVSELRTFDYREIAGRLGVEEMNKRLVETAREFQPDLIHLGKCEIISGKAIERIKQEIDTCVIHFYGDFNPTPQPWVVDIGRHADVTLFNYTDERIMSAYRQAGVRHIGGFWDAGTDPEIFYPRAVEKTDEVALMGNNLDLQRDGYDKRRLLVEEALEHGYDVHIYGNGWDYLRESGYSNLTLHPFVTEDEFAEACSRTKITLGINGVNDVELYASWRRTINSLACASFHLTHYVPGMERLFSNRENLVWFHSISEAMSLIDYYLSHDTERETIARQGREEVLKNHTWDARIAMMLQHWRENSSQKNKTGAAKTASKASPSPAEPADEQPAGEKIHLMASGTPEAGFRAVQFETGQPFSSLAEAGTVHSLICEDIVERMPVSQAQAAVSEWFRLLSPGGSISIRLLDAAKIFEDWLHKGVIDDAQASQLIFETGQGACRQTLVRAETLRTALQNAGFESVEILRTATKPYQLQLRAVKKSAI